MNRRSFLQTAMLAAAAQGAFAAGKAGHHIASNTYPWGTFAKREGREVRLHTDELLGAMAQAGIQGYEPIIHQPAEFNDLSGRLRAHGLEMRSLYMNSVLHDETRAGESIAAILAVARRAVELGTRIIVTNPAPLRWGGSEDKTDAQLVTQAKSLNHLGAELKKSGVVLAYHNHDSELRQGAREFHHMLTATDPELVRFCLDAHWVYRGCGDSQVALFDAVEHYGSRIVELHLRQSDQGRWSEVFSGAGDLDYPRLAAWLAGHRIKPHIVLEQAVEHGSPHTLTAVEAHSRSVKGALTVFQEVL